VHVFISHRVNDNYLVSVMF